MRVNTIVSENHTSTEQRREFVKLMGILLLFIATMAIQIKATDSTYTVSKVDSTKDGSFKIDYSVDGVNKSADISVEQGDDKDSIAGKSRKRLEMAPRSITTR